MRRANADTHSLGLANCTKLSSRTWRRENNQLREKEDAEKHS